MSNPNNICVCGNVTRDPDLRFIANGSATCTVGIAANRVWNDRKTGERKEDVDFFNVVVWGQMAENVAESIQKGDRIVVTGRLSQRSWETPEGEKKSVIDIVADDIGPSLRFATVTDIVKPERSEGNRSEGNHEPNGNRQDHGGQRDDGNRRQPARSGASGNYSSDPF